MNPLLLLLPLSWEEYHHHSQLGWLDSQTHCEINTNVTASMVRSGKRDNSTYALVQFITTWAVRLLLSWAREGFTAKFIVGGFVFCNTTNNEKCYRSQLKRSGNGGGGEERFNQTEWVLEMQSPCDLLHCATTYSSILLLFLQNRSPSSSTVATCNIAGVGRF